ncbi:uncharacterized protein LOC135048413 [Pseudophryne corroboree]|uniref:uncharacterized protein LOC135048413 n=1 Tax=Pseudophryne corroboree TaxID=495146 RepID=UPI003081F287
MIEGRRSSDQGKMAAAPDVTTRPGNLLLQPDWSTRKWPPASCTEDIYGSNITGAEVRAWCRGEGPITRKQPLPIMTYFRTVRSTLLPDCAFHIQEVSFHRLLLPPSVRGDQGYTVVKKISGECETPSSHPLVSGGLSTTHSPITVPPPHSLIHERHSDQKILELTNKIIQLLKGEEGEYIEEHRGLYKDMMMENHRPLTSLDGPSNRDTPERCPRLLYYQDCTEENHRIPQEDQVERLSNIKTEDTEGEEETYVTDIKAEDIEGEEETYVTDMKAEDIEGEEEMYVTDIKAEDIEGEEETYVTDIKAEDTLGEEETYVTDIKAENIEGEEETYVTDIKTEDIEGEEETYVTAIKAEDIEGEEETYVTDMKAEDIEGEEETYVTDIKAEDIEGEEETYVTDIKAEDTEGEEETYVRGDQQCKEEEIPTDINTGE